MSKKVWIIFTDEDGGQKVCGPYHSIITDARHYIRVKRSKGDVPEQIAEVAFEGRGPGWYVSPLELDIPDDRYHALGNRYYISMEILFNIPCQHKHLFLKNVADGYAPALVIDVSCNDCGKSGSCSISSKEVIW